MMAELEQFIENEDEELEEELDEELEEAEEAKSEPDASLESSEEPPGEPADPNEIPFVHLHVHSHYSLLDGAGKVSDLIARAKELNMPALALTDHGTLFGSLEFYQKCLAEGIKPIPGYEAYVAPGSRFTKKSIGRAESNYHLTLLAMNEKGFRNLLILGTLAYTEGFYRRPRIDKELLEKYSDGLICLSGCLSGELARTLANGNCSPAAMEQAKDIARWFRNLFGDRYYIELQDHGLFIQKEVLKATVEIANELNIPTVATNDVHYIRREDSEAQDILLCINTGALRTDPKRFRMDSDQFYLRSGREMLDAMPHLEDAIRRSVEIANRCDVQLILGKRFFPNFIPPNGLSSDDYLRELCIKGLKRRYADNPKRMVNGELTEEVMARLNRELGVIKKLGFPNYFLIVWDFVRVAEERGIQRTARGSGVGALVCYALNLSHVCPLEYDLLFERFLDENRVEAPDIDIDFEQSRRGEIIDYVKEKYGKDNVAQIGTFGTLAAKMAIKDVGRALSMPLPKVAEVTKMVPEVPKMTIKKAFEQNPELTKIYEEDRDVHELIDMAKRVEGLVRGVGTHACAVVISQRPLTEFLPIQYVAGKEEFVTQWAAADVEKAGLLKMDFLGLRNLTILSDAINIIEKTRHTRVDPYKFPTDDPETYQLLCRGETKGVFQLESGGMRELLARMKPDNFRDIIATLALYRPGPLDGGMVDDYIEVKHGIKEPFYLHPVMKDVLSETNGVMVYQEQIMRIINRLGKVPLGSAYTCIKAISKKKEALIQKYRDDFIRGAQENGLSEKDAQDVFALIMKFAGYGFNKSHSTAYAMVAYITAYLKAHYPEEFMAALLCGDINKRIFTKKDSTVEHLEDCGQMGIEIIPPNVNESFAEYTVKEGKITFGLCAIKACSEDAAKEIVRAREEGGPFKNIFDFYERIDTRQVSRSAVESLVKAGAFDCFGVKRSQTMQVLDKANKTGQAASADRARGQKSLFSLLGEEDEDESPATLMDQATVGLPNIEEWNDKEKAGYEKEVLGFYLTAHPLREYEEVFRLFGTHTVNAALRLPNRTPVIVGGMISNIKVATTKAKHEMYAMFDLSDTSDTIRTIIWPQQYTLYNELVKSESVVFAVGVIDRSRSQNEDDANLIVDRLMTVEQAKQELTGGLAIMLNETRSTEDIKVLYEILKTYRVNQNGISLEINIHLPNGRMGILKCPNFQLSFCEELRSRVVERFGSESLKLIPVAHKSERRPPRKTWPKKDDASA